MDVNQAQCLLWQRPFLSILDRVVPTEQWRSLQALNFIVQFLAETE